MSDTSKQFIDTALLTLSGEQFLLPTVAIAEVIIYQPKDTTILWFHDHQSPLLGEMQWRDQVVPLVAMNLEWVPIDQIHHPKIAILNAKFQNKDTPPFFAALFSDRPHKVQVKNTDISWLDSNIRKALLKTPHDAYEVNLIDIEQYSQTIETLIAKTGLGQISK